MVFRSWNRRLRLLPAARLLAAILAPADAAAARLSTPDCDAAGIPVAVEVHALRSTDGNLTVTIYGDRAADLLAPGRKLVRKRVTRTAAHTTARLNPPRPGAVVAAESHHPNGPPASAT